MSDKAKRPLEYLHDLSVDDQVQAVEKLRSRLHGERQILLSRARRTITETMTFDEGDLADETDLAIADKSQALEVRLRSRERVLMSKIEAALERLDAGEYFECTSCGEDIPLNRLRARPVTTQCIRCKEAQEIRERRYA